MKLRHVSALAVASLLAGAATANAAAVYSENFNNVAFQGASGINIPDTTDHWASANLYTINNADGWSLTGSAGFYVNNASGPYDGAVLLNECCIGDGTGAQASTTVSGLTPGHSYRLSFLEWGDNQPGGSYTLYSQIGATTPFSYNGVDGTAGSNVTGNVLSYDFVASSESETLVFSQGNSQGGGSPVIDDVSITAVPEPAAWAMMLLGVGMIGGGLRTARRKSDMTPTAA